MADLELRDTLLLTEDPNENKILELDELWSFVHRKSEKVWVWLALCRESRQMVAFATGDRSRATCERLWRAIPESYKKASCYGDFWEAYQEVIPEEQHEATGKEEGETSHVERYTQVTLFNLVFPANLRLFLVGAVGLEPTLYGF